MLAWCGRSAREDIPCQGLERWRSSCGGDCGGGGGGGGNGVQGHMRAHYGGKVLGRRPLHGGGGSEVLGRRPLQGRGGGAVQGRRPVHNQRKQTAQ